MRTPSPPLRAARLQRARWSVDRIAIAPEEERLRTLMDHEPDIARQMLEDLDAVEAEFPDPDHADEPLRVPPHVAARWQTAIAREAERRALGYPTDTRAGPGTTDDEAPDDHPDEGEGEL